jgi:hypothetical protein
MIGGCLVDVYGHDRKAAAGEDLSNSGTHRAETDHTDLGELA